MKDYLIEISKAKRNYTDAWVAFSDKLDEWEEEHEYMGEFSILLYHKDKKEVHIRFMDDNVNMDIVNKACEDFNLQITHKYTDENYVSKHTFIKFILRHKEKPY